LIPRRFGSPFGHTAGTIAWQPRLIGYGRGTGSPVIVPRFPNFRIRPTGGKVMMPYALYPARQQGLVMAAVGKTLSQSIYMDLYHSLTRYEHAEGPASVILDLTGVEHLTMSSSFVRSIVDMEPAVPVGMSRYVVAPQPVIFGLARMVQTLRSLTRAPVEVVRSLGEAYAAFGVSGHDFPHAV
jgi:hypothetical protein